MMNLRTTLRISMIFIGFIVFSACSSDDDDSSSNNSSEAINEIVNNVQSGDWIITEFIDSGENEINHFTGYTFTFSSNGDLIATSSETTLNGTWSVTNDSNSDDDSPDDNDIDFNIFFNVAESNNFEDLNDDWDILSYSSSKIELIDISGGNGGTDYLTFEKN